MAANLPASLDATSANEDVSFADYLSLIYEGRWLIAGIMAFVVALSVIYAFGARPIYEANILIQVEDSDLSEKNLLGDLAPLLDAKSATTAEIELLRSRLVVGSAVSSLKLFIEATPRHFPIIGGWVSNRYESRMSATGPAEIAPAFLGLSRFAWGGESIQVDQFDVPRTYWKKKFTLVATGPDSYVLKSSGDVVLEGKLNRIAKGRIDDGEVTLLVSRLTARPGTEFIIKRSSELQAVEDLQDDLKIEEKGKQSGILSVTLNGPNPKKTKSILDAVASEYVTQNVALKSAEAQQTIEFLDRQLPQLKSQLDDAEAKYNRFRNEKGTVNLSEEAKLILQQSVDSNTALLELQQRRLELRQRFTEEHPSVVALDKQIAAAKGQAESLGGRISGLPNLEQGALRLMRDVAVDTDLYTGLLNSAQQLRVLKAGKVGNVRVVDFAQDSEEPIKPKKALVIAMGVVLGAIFGVTTAFVRKAFFGGVESGDAIERATGLPIYATIPHSDEQRALDDAVRRRVKGFHILAHQNPADTAVESLRSLRTAIQFAMLEAENNVAMVTSPSPSVGKSFIVANLATIIASSGKKVLLIDCDLRRGHVHDCFALAREPGVSDFILGEISLEKVIQRDVLPGLDFISTGTVPPNPSELLTNARFSELLEKLRTSYDVVIVDSPPVLAVTDAAIIGKHAGTTLLALRYAQHPLHEIVESVRRLQHGGVALKGALLNDLPRTALGYGRRYGRYYAYEYGQLTK
ncbi:polysaccharide biosynthesis tyrosine autokinase [Paraburkholderia aromaticivorans]|uniref:polysaccharide biosynthesis tyrosine autokinase n=1 Tax=Paraburkholderia aromaticivorans TaxID=2026199 RepID=UPI0038B96CC1